MYNKFDTCLKKQQQLEEDKNNREPIKTKKKKTKTKIKRAKVVKQSINTC